MIAARLRRVAAAGIAVSLAACTTVYRAKFTPPEQAKAVEPDAPFLKCHMKDGSVYVLEAQWRIDAEAKRIDARGIHYDASRAVVDRATYHLSIDEVALFETNRPEQFIDEGIVVLAVLTIASIAVTGYCLSNPKACFGSCPTFYAFDGERESLQAEGFSASVARALEATDVDAMWTARPRGTAFDVRMTNDALETHAVDSVRLLAAPRPHGGRVLRDGDVFYRATSLAAPTACTSDSGDCRDLVATTDGREYKSDADPHDLATRETIDLRFDSPAEGRRGLLLVARNSLMNTFLFYQALAYMGRSAGQWVSTLERAGAGGAGAFRGLGSALGGIKVEVETAPGEWRGAGVWDEVGPIALEAQVVALPEDLPPGAVHARLTATRGYWRIEQAALAVLGDAVVPVPLAPVAVLRDSVSRPDALAKLRPGGEHLVTGPRDEWLMRFELPAGDQELFLESRGYYYEWMRPSWLEEEDAGELARFAFDSRRELRRLAPKYKRLEPDMDRVFWQSRLGAERLR
jgi:hypothetical protein